MLLIRSRSVEPHLDTPSSVIRRYWLDAARHILLWRAKFTYERIVLHKPNLLPARPSAAVAVIRVELRLPPARARDCDVDHGRGLLGGGTNLNEGRG